jgi:hypothetical protein
VSDDGTAAREGDQLVPADRVRNSVRIRLNSTGRSKRIETLLLSLGYFV